MSSNHTHQLTVYDMFRHLFVLIVIFRTADLQKRIYGGEKVRDPERYQFTIAFKLFKRTICGGALISQRSVLSAAHCFNPQKLGYYVAVTDPENTSPKLSRRIQEYRLHPEFHVPNPFSNDIAIVVLISPFELRTGVIPLISVAPKGYPWPVNDTAKVFGWGRTETEKDRTYLLYTNVNMINKGECLKFYGKQGKYLAEETMQCGKGMTGKSDACQKVAGGPLVHTKSGYLIGVVSFNSDCDDSEVPEVYMNTALYNDWIRKNVFDR